MDWLIYVSILSLNILSEQNIIGLIHLLSVKSLQSNGILKFVSKTTGLGDFPIIYLIYQ